MTVDAFRTLCSRLCLMGPLALAVAAGPVFAQEDTGQQPSGSAGSAVEVTPFVSMGPVAAPRIGAAFNFPVTRVFSVEVEAGYRRGEGHMNAFSSSVNMLYSLPTWGRIKPYLAAGAGLDEYGEPFTLSDRSEIFTRHRLGFTVNAGGGIKIPVDDKWGLRIDGRWFQTVGRGSEHWRIYQGITF